MEGFYFYLICPVQSSSACLISDASCGFCCNCLFAHLLAFKLKHKYDLAVILSDIELITERRFCDTCMAKTVHEVIEDPELVYTYKRRRLYRCQECGHKSYRRGL